MITTATTNNITFRIRAVDGLHFVTRTLGEGFEQFDLDTRVDMRAVYRKLRRNGISAADARQIMWVCITFGRRTHLWDQATGSVARYVCPPCMTS